MDTITLNDVTKAEQSSDGWQITALLDKDDTAEFQRVSDILNCGFHEREPFRLIIPAVALDSIGTIHKTVTQGADFAKGCLVIEFGFKEQL